MNFTTTQLNAIIAKTNFEGTVEEYAAQMGFTIKEIAKSTAVKKTSSRAQLSGKTSIVVISAASEGECFFTTNKGFAGRTVEWILNDWKKTVRTSRENFRGVLAAEDVEVLVMPPQAFATDADKAELEKDLASVLVEFVAQDYDVLSKVPSAVRVHMDTMLDERAKAEQEQQEQQEEQGELNTEEDSGELAVEEETVETPAEEAAEPAKKKRTRKTATK